MKDCRKIFNEAFYISFTTQPSRYTVQIYTKINVQLKFRSLSCMFLNGWDPYL